MAEQQLKRVRALCLALPEAWEKLSHGAPCFFVKKKQFCAFVDNHHGDGRLAVWVRAPHEGQDLLVRMDPERFFVPAYVGHLGWVGIRLEGRAPWDQVEKIITDGWKLAAPKKLLAEMKAT